MDINPSNAMFSKSQNKIVFIDFGLSTVIEEDCGFKTFTTFRGTPQYVSKEMLSHFSI
jgi:serine/threonine protein kinase